MSARSRWSSSRSPMVRIAATISSAVGGSAGYCSPLLRGGRPSDSRASSQANDGGGGVQQHGLHESSLGGTVDDAAIGSTPPVPKGSAGGHSHARLVFARCRTRPAPTSSTAARRRRVSGYRTPRRTESARVRSKSRELTRESWRLTVAAYPRRRKPSGPLRARVSSVGCVGTLRSADPLPRPQSYSPIATPSRRASVAPSSEPWSRWKRIIWALPLKLRT